MKMNNKLLIPGWAGQLTDGELYYIRDSLKKDGWLRRRWGMTNKRMVSGNNIRHVAMYGNTEDIKVNKEFLAKR